MVSPELLQDLRLFVGLSGEEQARVAAIAHEARYAKDVVIFQEDTEAEDLYVVLEGRVALRFRLGMHTKSKQVTIDAVQPGEVMGWSALVPPRKLTASAVCLEPVRALTIEGAELRTLLDSDPRLGYAVMNNLAEVIATRLRDTRLQLAQEIGQTDVVYGRW